MNLNLFLMINIIIVLISTYLKIKDTHDQKKIKKNVKKMLLTTENTNKIINEIGNKKEKEIKKFEDKNKLISKLINEGLISEREIYKKIKENNFFYLFCYQNVPEQSKIQKILGKDFRNPTLVAIESIGFLKVGKMHNFYIVPTNYLSEKLNNLQVLESLIRNTVKKHWKKFLSELQNENRKFYLQYIEKNPNPTNCTYFLSESRFHEVIINHIKYNAFSKGFKELLNRQINIKKLRDEVKKKKHEIKKFVLSISYDLFLDNMPNKDKKIFIEKERMINNTLKIKNFIDYRNKKDELIKTLENHFNDKKAKEYGSKISFRSRKYYKLFKDLGINLN